MKHTKLNKRGKPKTIQTLRSEMIRNKIADRLSEEIDPILKSQIKIAKNTKSPLAVQAFKTLTEQSIGKPKEQHEHKHVVGIVQLVEQLESNDEEEDV